MLRRSAALRPKLNRSRSPSERLFLFRDDIMKIESNRTLRLQLGKYPGVEQALKTLARKECRSDSMRAIQLVAEGLDARRLSEKQEHSPEFQMLLRLVAEAAKTGTV